MNLVVSIRTSPFLYFSCTTNLLFTALRFSFTGDVKALRPTVVSSFELTSSVTEFLYSLNYEFRLFDSVPSENASKNINFYHCKDDASMGQNEFSVYWNDPRMVHAVCA